MIKFLLIVLVVSFVVRRLVPYLVRFFLARFIRQQARAAGQGFGGPSADPFRSAGRGPFTEGPAGPVRVAYAPPPKPRQPDPKGFKGGEYVEFEEVKP